MSQQKGGQGYFSAARKDEKERLATPVQCKVITKKGRQCAHVTYNLSGYCDFHEHQGEPAGSHHSMEGTKQGAKTTKWEQEGQVQNRQDPGRCSADSTVTARNPEVKIKQEKIDSCTQDAQNAIPLTLYRSLCCECTTGQCISIIWCECARNQRSCSSCRSKKCTRKTHNQTQQSDGSSIKLQSTGGDSVATNGEPAGSHHPMEGTKQGAKTTKWEKEGQVQNRHDPGRYSADSTVTARNPEEKIDSCTQDAQNAIPLTLDSVLCCECKEGSCMTCECAQNQRNCTSCFSNEYKRKTQYIKLQSTGGDSVATNGEPAGSHHPVEGAKQDAKTTKWEQEGQVQNRQDPGRYSADSTVTARNPEVKIKQEKIDSCTQDAQNAIPLDHAQHSIGTGIKGELNGHPEVTQESAGSHPNAATNSAVPSVQCKGIAKSTKSRCMKLTNNPNGYCHHHQDQAAHSTIKGESTNGEPVGSNHPMEGAKLDAKTTKWEQEGQVQNRQDPGRYSADSTVTARNPESQFQLSDGSSIKGGGDSIAASSKTSRNTTKIKYRCTRCMYQCGNLTFRSSGYCSIHEPKDSIATASNQEVIPVITHENNEVPLDLNVVCWNINGKTGKGYAETRGEIVNETLKSMKLDIVCLQENSLMSKNEKFKQRIPISTNHRCVEVTENNSQHLHNQVLYDTSKFTSSSVEVPEKALEQAYQLMTCEKKIIDWVCGEEDRIKNFTDKTILTSNDEHVQAVIDDLRKQIAIYDSDIHVCRNHFIRKGKTLDPKELLEGRAAMAFLTIKKPSTTLLVISFHSYHPTKNPEGLNYLLFSLVEKLIWCIAPISVLICGDFNEDIAQSNDPMVREFIKNYMVPKYNPTLLREKKRVIDYIILRKPKVSVSLVVNAADIVIPTEHEQNTVAYQQQFFDHSPLVATLTMKGDVAESTS